MSDDQVRVLSAAIIAAAGGITFGLGAIAQALRPGHDEPWWIVGVLILLVGGITWAWALRKPSH